MKLARTFNAVPVRGFSNLVEYVPVRSYLVREFIHHSLYHPAFGYFNTDFRISNPLKPLDFPSLKGKPQYENEISKIYQSSKSGWLTPVEIFQPYYAEAVLSWIMHIRNKKYGGDNNKMRPPLKILEVGAGNGTCALNILDKLSAAYPSEYEHVEYHITELSKPLHELQRLLLAHHSKKIKLYHIDVLKWDTQIEDECFVIGLEVLDNMPHDKIVVRNNVFKQVIITSTVSPPLRTPSSELISLVNSKRPYKPPTFVFGDIFEEKCENLNDPWIQYCLSIKNTMPSLRYNFRWNFNYLLSAFSQKLTKSMNRLVAEDAFFIPTGSLQFLSMLAKYIPNHYLLLNDFEYLVNTIVGDTAPVVSSKRYSRVYDCSTYYEQVGEKDIFFPTDFDLLAHMYKHACEKEGEILTNTQFLKKYGDHKRTQTQDGYNPLLEDYKNMNFFVTKV